MCEGCSSLSYATQTVSRIRYLLQHMSHKSLFLVWSSTSCRTVAIILDSRWAMFPHILIYLVNGLRDHRLVLHFHSINNDKPMEMTENSPLSLERLRTSLHQDEWTTRGWTRKGDRVLLAVNHTSRGCADARLACDYFSRISAKWKRISWTPVVFHDCFVRLCLLYYDWCRTRRKCTSQPMSPPTIMLNISHPTCCQRKSSCCLR